jgi:GNAT superfamily N-acetyltransferase
MGTDRLFADRELAARIERAACDLMRDCAGAIARRHDDPVTVRPIAGGVAVHTGEGSPLNKVAGVGFEGIPSNAELDSVESVFAAARAPVQVELSCLAEAGIAELFTRRGYFLAGFENVLGLRLPLDRRDHERRRAGEGEVEVALSVADELPTWFDVVATGFAHPDAQGVASHETFSRETMERVMNDLASAPSMVRYLARRGAGGASMRARDGVCQLCGAATLPAHRRHGIQSAMLERRLADATRAGCDVAVVTTLPGSKSQQNVQRLGFDLLYTRAILVLG